MCSRAAQRRWRRRYSAQIRRVIAGRALAPYFAVACAVCRLRGEMKTTSLLIGLLLLSGPHAGVNSQEPIAISSDSTLKVILLGTAGGPTTDAQRLGISTLIL